MVVVRLAGGLGNQMFQYALGRHLAERRGDRLVLDLAWLCGRPGTTPRHYGLEMFNIEAERDDVDRVARSAHVLATLTQCDRGFHPQVLEHISVPNLAIEGYWQSERYFADVAPIIRANFSFKTCGYAYECPALPAQIAAVESVCVHVRRGDFAGSADHFLGVVGVDYYTRAIQRLAASVRRPHFFVFSDDIPWCRDHLPFNHPHTFVGHARGAAESVEEDMRLMTMCRHFILANSAFSWWAAWLANRGDGGIVIAPRRWYNPDGVANGWKTSTCLARPHRTDTTDLIPARWLCL